MYCMNLTIPNETQVASNNNFNKKGNIMDVEQSKDIALDVLESINKTNSAPIQNPEFLRRNTVSGEGEEDGGKETEYRFTQEKEEDEVA